MSPNREELLFALALEKPADKRAAFLDAMCEGGFARTSRSASRGARATGRRARHCYTRCQRNPGGESVMYNAAFSADGSVLSSVSVIGQLHLWRAPTWAEINAAEAKEKTENQQP